MVNFSRHLAVWFANAFVSFLQESGIEIGKENRSGSCWLPVAWMDLKSPPVTGAAGTIMMSLTRYIIFWRVCSGLMIGKVGTTSLKICPKQLQTQGCSYPGWRE